MLIVEYSYIHGSPVSILLARGVSICSVKTNTDIKFLKLLLHFFRSRNDCCLLVCLLVPENRNDDHLLQKYCDMAIFGMSAAGTYTSFAANFGCAKA